MMSAIPDSKHTAEMQNAALQARIYALEEAAQDLLNAEIDRWAAQTDHAVFAANAVIVAAHDALAELLETSDDDK